MKTYPRTTWLMLVTCCTLLTGNPQLLSADDVLSTGALCRQARAELRAAVEEQSEWVKVHAAEALILLGDDTGLNDEFDRELAKHESVPQYRIGIWRVKAQLADDPAPWHSKMHAVLLDANANDRLHSVESWAKLNVPLPEGMRNEIAGISSKQDEVMQVMTAWTLAASCRDDEEDVQRVHIAELLRAMNSENERVRSLAGYGLRFLSNVTPAQWTSLAREALAEPTDSAARVYLLSAAVCSASPKSDHDMLTRCHAALRKLATSPSKSDRYEMCEGLSFVGTTDDLPILRDLLQNKTPLPVWSDDAANRVLLEDRSEIISHPDNVDVRIAASKAVLRIVARDGNETIAVTKQHGTEGATDDWPAWRGPQRNGVASTRQHLPVHWSRDENVVWRSDIPGKGHGSPSIVADQVFLATADGDAQTQLLVALDRNSGKILWQTAVHQGNLIEKMNKRSSHASGTPACDGERVFINFLNDDAVTTTAVDRRTGEKVWQRRITDYTLHQGYGSSPILYDNLVLVSADNKAGGAIVGLDRATGDEVWRVDRPTTPNYPSPIVLHVAGRDQLIMFGCDLVTGIEPATGKTLWEIDGATTECVTSTVTNGDLIYTSGGYPRNHISAVHGDGSGKVAWESTVRVYVPSLLIHGSHLYGVTDAGVAMCWESSTGEIAWRQRLGGTFYSSPVLIGNSILVGNETGDWHIYRADPNAFESIGQNQLGDEVYATPVVVGGRIYMRVAEVEGTTRQERLYCFGK